MKFHDLRSFLTELEAAGELIRVSGELSPWYEVGAAVITNALFPRAGTPYSKIVVVDTDVDILDPEEIAWALGSRVRPDRDIIIKPALPGFVIDPSTSGSEEIGELSRLQTRTAKIGVDATKPLGERDKYEKVDVPSEVRLKITRMLGI